MSSHWAWQEKIVAQHDLEKPFAPENGKPLKFQIGDPVVFTNDNGVTFKHRIAGFYHPTDPCSLYASGRRYLLDWECPWFPVKEDQLELDDSENRSNRYGEPIDHPAHHRVLEQKEDS